MFDLSPFKLVILAVIALVVFGPYELPKLAQQVGRALRDLRRLAEGAQADLREGLGPEFQDFDLQDLNPRRFVQKHLIDDINAAAQPIYDEYNGATTSNGAASNGAAAGANRTRPTLLEGAEPPFDMEAT